MRLRARWATKWMDCFTCWAVISFSISKPFITSRLILQRIDAYSPPRRPYGDQVWRPDYRMQKHCAFLQMLLHIRKAASMVAVRGRPSGLPGLRYRFANLRTAATRSFGDDWVVVNRCTYRRFKDGKIYPPHRNRSGSCIPAY